MPFPNSSIPSGGVFDLPTREARLEEIEGIISSPDAWSNQEALTPVLREKSRLEAAVARFRELRASYEEMEEWLRVVSGGGGGGARGAPGGGPAGGGGRGGAGGPPPGGPPPPVCGPLRARIRISAWWKGAGRPAPLVLTR